MESRCRIKILRKGIPLLFALVSLSFLLPVHAAEPGQKLVNLTGMKTEYDAGMIRVSITADGPLVYSYYKLSAPPKGVLDFAQTAPATGVESMKVESGDLNRINVLKNVLKSGTLTRIEFELEKDTPFFVVADQDDRTKITVLVGTADPLKRERYLLKEGKAREVPSAAPVSVSVKPAPAVEPPAVAPPVAPPEPVVAAKENVREPSVAETAPPVNPPAAPAAEPEKPSQDPPVRVEVLKADKTEKTPSVSEPVKVSAAASGTPAVRGVSVGQDGILVATDGSVEKYSSFKLTKPDRLVIDLLKTKNGIQAKQLPLAGFGVTAVRIGSHPDKTRLVFDGAAGSFATYRITPVEGGLRISLGKGSGATPPVEAAQAASPPPTAAPVAAAPAAAPETAAAAKPAPAASAPGLPGPVTALEFKVTDEAARVQVRTGAGCQVMEPQRTPDGVVLTIRNCALPKTLQKTLDTSKFNTVVSRVTPYNVKLKKATDTKILVITSKPAPFELKREGDFAYLDIRNEKKAPPRAETEPAPLPRAEAAPIPQPQRETAKAAPAAEAPAPRTQPEVSLSLTPPKPGAKKAYTGRRVTLEFADADIRKIFQLLAEVSNQNFLIGDDVSGTISIKLVNVPWDQALDVILETKGLDTRTEGNIVQIKPKGKFKSQDEEAIEIRKTREKMMELKTQVFDVNFASLADVAAQFKTLGSGRPDASVTSDSRTNKVIVTDIQTKIDRMKELLDTIDVPEKQVMIEARIVEASSTFTRDLGIQWGVHYRDVSSSILGVNTFNTGFGGNVSTAPSTGTFGPGAAAGISFGKLGSNIQLDLRISAAVSAGQVKIISTPRIATLNNKAAKISQGQSIPYQNTTSTTGAVTQFVEAALTLEVTPHVTPDGSVVMQIKASNNSPGSGNPPPINKKEATTELLVKNGETTVIGGIYVDSDTDSDQGVPYLSDIPWLGHLFKSSTKTKTKTELLIFITPKILS